MKRSKRLGLRVGSHYPVGSKGGRMNEILSVVHTKKSHGQSSTTKGEKKMGQENGGSIPSSLRAGSSQSEKEQTTINGSRSGEVANGYFAKFMGVRESGDGGKGVAHGLENVRVIKVKRNGNSSSSSSSSSSGKEQEDKNHLCVQKRSSHSERRGQQHHHHQQQQQHNHHHHRQQQQHHHQRTQSSEHSRSRGNHTSNHHHHHHTHKQQQHHHHAEQQQQQQQHHHHAEQQQQHKQQSKHSVDQSESSKKSSPHGSSTERSSGRHGNRESKFAVLEQHHVHDVYEKTAHHFRDVRLKAWPKVKQFLEELQPGSLVADIGCGQGKYLHINKSVYSLGSDRSAQLTGIARGQGHEVMVCDNLHLPYRAALFDGIISIGVIHHMTSCRRRVAAIAEIARVLRPGGRVMIYVWAMEQKQRKFKSQDVLVPWHLRPHWKVGPVKRSMSDPQSEQPIRSQRSRSHRCRSESQAPPNSAPPSHATSLQTSPDDQLPGKVMSPSLPSMIKLRFLNLFGSNDEDTIVQKEQEAKREKVREDYRKLFEQIWREDIETYRKYKPVLEHSKSASEVEEFAVREFPQSSRPRYPRHLSMEKEHNVHISNCNDHVSPSSAPASASCSLDVVSSSHSRNASSLKKKEVGEKEKSPAVQSALQRRRLFQNKELCMNGENVCVRPKAASVVGVVAPPGGGRSSRRDSWEQDEEQRVLNELKPPMFSIGCGTSDTEVDNWVSATTQAIKTVESQVEKISSSNNYFTRHSSRQRSSSTSGASDWHPDGLKIIHRDGTFQIVNGRNRGRFGIDPGEYDAENNSVPLVAAPAVKSRASRGSSVSSLSSDNGTCSETDDCGTYLETDQETGENNNNNGGDDDDGEVVADDEVFQQSPRTKTIPQKTNAPKEMLAPNERDDKELYKRFYHVFKEGELKDLIEKHVSCLKVVDSYYDHANWCVIAEKLEMKK